MSPHSLNSKTAQAGDQGACTGEEAVDDSVDGGQQQKDGGGKYGGRESDEAKANNEEEAGDHGGKAGEERGDVPSTGSRGQLGGYALAGEGEPRAPREEHHCRRGRRDRDRGVWWWTRHVGGAGIGGSSRPSHPSARPAPQ